MPRVLYWFEDVDGADELREQCEGNDEWEAKLVALRVASAGDRESHG